MKRVGYFRVSTDWQVEDGFGLAAQEKMIRTWRRQQGHTLGGAVYRDEGVLRDAYRPRAARAG
ncbi:hypothetical protein [Streptomyces sp. NPDC057696]|uniref:hypothetical protein n=1 Tax=Streptomyces sp. NPDC057696 TaxID=3346218 RepID=UPI0036B62230